MKRGLALLALALALAPVGASALQLRFPSPAQTTADHDARMGSYQLAVGPWVDGAIKTILAEGPMQQTAWRIDTRDVTTMELLADLRDQLVKANFRILYQCDTDDCGGFDFRYGIDVLPEPEMHVDLGDFRYLAARRQTATGPEFVSLLVSHSSAAGFVQVVRVGKPADRPVALTPSTKTPAAPMVMQSDGTETPGTGIAASLETNGSAPLEDLSFDTGSADLSSGDFASLAELATYLKENPDRSVVLVGHTDAEGGLDGNIALSKRRAASVRGRLVQDYGVDPAQVTAEGVGFLAPRASNLTEDGRAENRRVEAILTSTQ